MNKEEEIKELKFIMDEVKSHLEFSNTIKELNQDNPKLQGNIEKLEEIIQILQNKLELEKLKNEPNRTQGIQRT